MRRIAAQDWRDQLADIRPVLVVAIGIDDDIGAKLQTGVEAVAKAAGQTDIPLVTNDMLDPDLASDLRGAIRTAVIDDEDLHRIDAGKLTRDVGDCLR